MHAHRSRKFRVFLRSEGEISRVIWVGAGFTSSTTLLSASFDAQSTLAIFLDLDFALSLSITLTVIF
jgi:hypothetical protein